MPQISAGDTVGVNGFVYTYYERLKEVQELPDLLLASVPIALAISALAYDETVESASPLVCVIYRGPARVKPLRLRCRRDGAAKNHAGVAAQANLQLVVAGPGTAPAPTFTVPLG
jgi:hypothetical protein